MTLDHYLGWLVDIWPLIEREWNGVETHEGTASELMARVAHVETLPGKVAFVATLTAGSAWLAWHICQFQYSSKAGS